MKWVDSIISKVVTIKEVVGINIVILEDGKMEFQWCLLKSWKGTVTIEESDAKTISSHELGNLNFLEDKKEIPMVVCLEGKGIISRIVDQKDFNKHSPVVHNILPNANENDFNVELSWHNNQACISVVRTEFFQSITDNFLSNNFNLFKLFFGPNQLLGLLDTDEIGDTKIHTSGYQILVQEDKITIESSHQFDPATNQLLGQTLPFDRSMAYAAALSLFMVEGSDQNSIQNDQFMGAEWNHRQFFKRFSPVLAGVLMILLLINFLWNSSVNTRNSELNQEFSINNTSLQELSKLQAEYNEKQKFLSVIGWSANAKVAFFADRLAATLPKNIYWENLVIFPLIVPEEKKSKNIVFNNLKLQIEGVSDGPVQLNEWLNEIDQLDWIEGITGQEYKYDSRKQLGKFKFEIDIARK